MLWQEGKEWQTQGRDEGHRAAEDTLHHPPAPPRWLPPHNFKHPLSFAIPGAQSHSKSVCALLLVCVCCCTCR